MASSYSRSPTVSCSDGSDDGQQYQLPAWKIFNILLRDYEGRAKLSQIRLLFPKRWTESEIKDRLQTDCEKRFSVFLSKTGDILSVSVHCRAKVCLNYGQGHCYKANCEHFHLCRNHIAGHCKSGVECPKSHSLQAEWNKNLLKRLRLVNYSEDELKCIIRQSALQVCPFYNSSGCKFGDTCENLHVCARYVMTNCGQNDCGLEHALDSEHSRRLLQCFELDTLAEKDVKKSLMIKKDRQLQKHLHDLRVSDTARQAKLLRNRCADRMNSDERHSEAAEETPECYEEDTGDLWIKPTTRYSTSGAGFTTEEEPLAENHTVDKRRGYLMKEVPDDQVEDISQVIETNDEACRYPSDTRKHTFPLRKTTPIHQNLETNFSMVSTTSQKRDPPETSCSNQNKVIASPSRLYGDYWGDMLPTRQISRRTVVVVRDQSRDPMAYNSRKEDNKTDRRGFPVDPTTDTLSVLPPSHRTKVIPSSDRGKLISQSRSDQNVSVAEVNLSGELPSPPSQLYESRVERLRKYPLATKDTMNKPVADKKRNSRQRLVEDMVTVENRDTPGGRYLHGYAGNSLRNPAEQNTEGDPFHRDAHSDDAFVNPQRSRPEPTHLNLRWRSLLQNTHSNKPEYITRNAKPPAGAHEDLYRLGDPVSRAKSSSVVEKLKQSAKPTRESLSQRDDPQFICHQYVSTGSCSTAMCMGVHTHRPYAWFAVIFGEWSQFNEVEEVKIEHARAAKNTCTVTIQIPGYSVEARINTTTMEAFAFDEQMSVFKVKRISVQKP